MNTPPRDIFTHLYNVYEEVVLHCSVFLCVGWGGGMGMCTVGGL